MSWTPTGWQTPVTNREYGARIVPSDMTRIVGNTNLILSDTINSPMAYTFNGTDKRFVTVEQWSDIIKYSKQLDHFSIGINNSSSYTNFNNIELVDLYNYYYKNDDERRTLSITMKGFKLGGTQF